MDNEQEKVEQEEKKTVGQVGSSLEGGLDPEPDEQVTTNDLKGKTVDADVTDESDLPADQ